MKINAPWQNIIIGTLLIGIFCMGFFVTYLSLSLSKAPLKKNGPIGTALTQNSTPAPTVLDENQKPGNYNVVLLGYGGLGHSGSLLTDSIILLHVDASTRTAALISIPRDLYVPGNHKINAAGIEGFQNVAGVIQNVTGIPVTYFVAVDFGGFAKLIDDLGGISVNVPKTFDDPFYPITGLENDTCGKTEDEINALKAKYSDYQLEIQFTCRYEHLHFDKGPANLDGKTALKFVRSRHGDSDFGRSERQFAVLKGILSKLISLRAFENGNKIIDTLSKIVKTNIGSSSIKDIIEVVKPGEDYKLKETHLTTDNVLNEGKSKEGAYILYPKAGMFNFTEIRNYISASISIK